MRDINITLSEDVAGWLGNRAAEENKTLAEWVSEFLEKARRRHHDYRIARQMMLPATPARIDPPGERGHRRAGLSDQPGRKLA